jgi:citrate synthase
MRHPRRGEKIPGFWHFVYKTADPRARPLLDLVRKAAPKSRRLAVADAMLADAMLADAMLADAMLAEARRRSLPEPNIDFAIATLATSCGMIRGAGEAMRRLGPPAASRPSHPPPRHASI